MDNISCISSLQAVVENLLVQTFSEEQRSGHETETSSHASERMQLPIQSIDRISSAISLDDFFQKYLLKNIPCIISKWITKDWTSCKQWSVLHNGRSLPNFQEFLGLGSSVVSVADCRYALVSCFRSENVGKNKQFKAKVLTCIEYKYSYYSIFCIYSGSNVMF